MKTTNNGKKGGVLVGKKHSEGGIKAIVTDVGQQVELESEELIVNAKSSTSNKVYTVTGTPKEIVSAVNSVDGNGVVIKNGAILKDHQTGRVVKMEQGGSITSERNEIYKEWKELVNMTHSELSAFLKTEEGKEAGMSRSEAKEEGISSGQDSARAILRMLKKKKEDWTETDYKWAKKQINFIKRMSGNKGGLFDDKGNKTRKHTSLLLWGNNPKKMALGGGVPNRIYISEGGADISVSNLEKAKELYKNGVENEDIRQKTGWFLNPYDKKWRYEIDDSKFGFKNEEKLHEFLGSYDNIKSKMDKETYPSIELSELIVHDELFKHYPFLKDVPVVFRDNISAPASILVLSDRLIMIVNPKLILSERFKNRMETDRYVGYGNKKGTTLLRMGAIIHEIQHLIQEHEGLAKGTSIEEEVKFIRSGQSIDANIQEDYIKDRAIYRVNRSAGELEAMDSDYRKDLTDFERKNIKPFNWVPFGEDEVIVNLENTYNPKKMELGGIVESDNFKKWFGDSKVVDKEGNPLVVYHGTHNDFNTFDKSKIGDNHWQSKSDAYGGGFFFTDKKNKAFSGNIKEVFLKIENPLIFSLEDKYGYEPDYYSATDKIDMNPDNYFRQAYENGNDGIMITTPRGSLYVAFEPNQIKLADGTNTTFDADNPDIRMAQGGSILKGGKADGMTLEDIAKKHGVSMLYIKNQFDKGLKVELEHTSSKKVASEIVLDHLFESENYYIELEKTERKFEDGGSVKSNIITELILYKNGKEFLDFKDDDDFRYWLKNRYNGDMWDEDPENYEDAEELSINDDYIRFWVDSNEGSEYRVEEIERELTLGEMIKEVISEIESEYDINFNKSSNNSWYYKNYEDDIQIRVSDHNPVYPCEMGRCFNIVVNDESDLDTLKDRVISDGNLYSKSKFILAKGGEVKMQKRQATAIRNSEGWYSIKMIDGNPYQGSYGDTFASYKLKSDAVDTINRDPNLEYVEVTSGKKEDKTQQSTELSDAISGLELMVKEASGVAKKELQDAIDGLRMMQGTSEPKKEEPKLILEGDVNVDKFVKEDYSRLRIDLRRKLEALDNSLKIDYSKLNPYLREKAETYYDDLVGEIKYFEGDKLTSESFETRRNSYEEDSVGNITEMIFVSDNFDTITFELNMNKNVYEVTVDKEKIGEMKNPKGKGKNETNDALKFIEKWLKTDKAKELIPIIKMSELAEKTSYKLSKESVHSIKEIVKDELDSSFGFEDSLNRYISTLNEIKDYFPEVIGSQDPNQIRMFKSGGSIIDRPYNQGNKSRALSKIAADKELQEKGFHYDYLTDAYGSMNLETWEKSESKFDNFELYTKKIGKKGSRRAIKTNRGDFYYLTTQKMAQGGLISFKPIATPLTR